MYKVGETVRYWGVKVGGLTWLSAEAMIGRILSQNTDDNTYVIEGRSGAAQAVPERLIEVRR
ncbi:MULTISPECIES: hypothetical protein [Bacillus amyloliquefaciens group]|uniref:hypothetical protein n=1 Tax=Bacillus amyloliquefaciens group TaxID=1938374 RepID=UPI000B928593|nr:MULTISPECIES: hypothetical protein [Bacillus amyloliquefaciens group]ASS61519.1 hypothetical protein CHN56_00975 [Bacillus velezensis]MEC1904043.1 hypothetical protein [Bacillus velezensis]MED0752291.1 hypothetical protein [Bacillus amyloliquefaciens]WJM61089.1 hypothetical protein QTN46_16735 [Bacillus amyloliquefaciens]